MAYFFEMAVSFSDRKQANQFAARFDQSIFKPNRLQDPSVGFDLHVHESGACLVHVFPHWENRPHDYLGVSGSAESEEHANLLTQVGHELYRRLKNYPGKYRMACVGFEASSAYFFEETAFLENPEPFGGLVICEQLFNSEDMKQFKRFNDSAMDEGYYWNPWLGEK